MPRFTYGGQALIEGVMMRGRDAVAVALRHPDGRIVWAQERLDQGTVHGHRAAKWPFVRGLVVLYETLVAVQGGTKLLESSDAEVVPNELRISPDTKFIDNKTRIGQGEIALPAANL